MQPENPEPATEAGLIVRSGEALDGLPDGGTPAMAEMINRSLAHIQTRKALAVPQRRAGEECEFEIVPGVKMIMCWIPPGEFLMGSPVSEKGRERNETQHRVRITQGFWLAKAQVTQAQWQAVIGENHSHFKGEDFPVESVNWYNICGNESGTGGFLGELNKVMPGAGRFHLPTEAQWEYACRAGTTGVYAGDLDELGWYRDNSDGQTHPVGQKKPNAWGLHDMHGNVWEWCADWFGDYGVSNVTDSSGPARGSFRVVRGGGWSDIAGNCRGAIRGKDDPGGGYYNYMGFRPARSSVS